MHYTRRSPARDWRSAGGRRDARAWLWDADSGSAGPAKARESLWTRGALNADEMPTSPRATVERRFCVQTLVSSHDRSDGTDRENESPTASTVAHMRLCFDHQAHSHAA